MHATTKHKVRCLVCSSPELVEFLETGPVPVSSVLASSREEAQAVPTAKIRLVYCAVCGHIFNAAFDPDLLEYTPAYDNALDFSPRFQDYVRELAEYLVARCDLTGKHIVEVGCGRGNFLRLLCRLGNSRGTGFDPAWVASNGNGSEQITWVQDYYSEGNARPADFVCSRHMLEHLPEPLAFLSTVAQAVRYGSVRKVFFEVPNVIPILRFAIWDVIYPHVSYFSRSSLTRLLAACGFSVTDIWTAFEDQFLCVLGQTGAGRMNAEADSRSEQRMMIEAIAQFSEIHRRTIETWSTYLDHLIRQGQRVVIWGAGTKAVSFLTTVRGADEVHYVVDLNWRKHGKFLPLSAQQVVSPHFLLEYKPDAVVIMNPNYEAEVRQSLYDLGLAACTVISVGGQHTEDLQPVLA